MDTATGDNQAVECTSSREGDSPVPPDLLDQIRADEQVGTVTGDGAFDTRRCKRLELNWKNWSGYHAQSRIKAEMRCLESLNKRIT